jgi:hypothetical protein
MEHGGEIVEGERNGVYVLIWECVCGAKGKGSATQLQAINGLRNHCGYPPIRETSRPGPLTSYSSSRW